MANITRHAEQGLWGAILYQQGVPNPDLITVLPMPPDSSCFYHAVYNALICLPDKVITPVRNLFNTYHTRLIQFLSEIDHGATELTIPQHNELDHTHILRYMVAINTTDADFESYQILCIAEPENHMYDNIYNWRTGLLLNLNHDYANMVTISIMRRVLLQQAGLDLGIYIYCTPSQENDGGLTSDSEWHGKPYNIFLELVDNVHYNLIRFTTQAHIIGAGVILTPEQLQCVYWGRTRSNKRTRIH